ncbi:MAG: cadmium-translocating P-type ATPase [Pseudorhodoplanes sp.]|nr:cadmium-translocating P-type ATPase [Pseudorhodoplanes sp.]
MSRAAEKQDFSLFAKAAGDGRTTMDFVVEGVRCGGCISRIESALKKQPGIRDARVNFTSRRLTVVWDDRTFDPAAAIRLVEGMGYRTHPFTPRADEREEAAQASFLLRCLAVAGFGAMNIMLLSVSVWSGNVTDITPETRDLFHWLSALIALPVAAYAGQPFFRSAWSVLRVGKVNMDVPISLGIVLALGMSLVETAGSAEHAYFDSAVMLIFFLLCGRYLDHAMRRKTRAVAGNLAAMKAETAHRLSDNGELIEVPAAALMAGDRVLVRAGDRVPADGVVVGGSSRIDESIVTGETTAREIVRNSAVYAGSLNLDGTFTLRVTAAGDNTLLDDIDRLLQKAVGSRSKYVRLADRAAQLYAPVVHATAALTLAGWLLAGASVHAAVLTAICVLIITCPCALALAVPAVQVVTAGKLFRSGIFLNSGDAIERLAEVDTVVFDKTGTLTLPDPQIVNANTIDPALLQQAAALALSSRHPLAAAIARHVATAQPILGAVEEAGKGVRATVDGIELRLGSLAFCGIDDTANPPESAASVIGFRAGDRFAVMLIHQALRPEAHAVVRSLSRLGLQLHVLSGDRAAAVAEVAEGLPFSSWQGGLKPGDKVAFLDRLKSEGRRVLMVGDGINDAPALAAALVSMSPISAAQLSQAQADAVFVGDRLTPVLEALTTSREARRLMTQNLWLAALYNMVAVPIAIAGLVTPLIAALAMSGSSIVVTLNALRLRRPSGRQRADADMPLQPRTSPA